MHGFRASNAWGVQAVGLDLWVSIVRVFWGFGVGVWLGYRVWGSGFRV